MIHVIPSAGIRLTMWTRLKASTKLLCSQVPTNAIRTIQTVNTAVFTAEIILFFL
jgi:hypothetical protein